MPSHLADLSPFPSLNTCRLRLDGGAQSGYCDGSFGSGWDPFDGSEAFPEGQKEFERCGENDSYNGWLYCW